MDLLAGLMLVAIGVYLVSFLFLVVAAFRVNIGWGLASLLFSPVALAFVIVHWNNGGKRIIGVLVGFAAMVGVFATEFATDPQLSSPFWQGFAEGLNRRGFHLGETKPKRPDPRAPHEVRDLAENETASTSAPASASVVDPRTAERAALARHSAELNTMYAELNKERPSLKKGSPEVAAFNAKAAKYQEGVKSLVAEQAQLDALDHPAAAAAKPR